MVMERRIAAVYTHNAENEKKEIEHVPFAAGHEAGAETSLEYAVALHSTHVQVFFTHSSV
jgi:hypothetical protein